MNSNKHQVPVFLGSLLAAAVLSGVAAAGNPHGTPPGQAKHQSSNTVSSSSSASNTTGVKPSSTTSHNTHAAAGSSGTKSYGNGHTAGEIAEQNGASASTDLYGPGNSQPHKVALCPNGTHRVDVHALKAHAAVACAGGNSNRSSASTSASAAGSAAVSGTGAAAKTHLGVHARARVKGAFTPPRSRNGGVLGTQHTVTARAKPAHAVLGSANFTG